MSDWCISRQARAISPWQTPLRCAATVADRAKVVLLTVDLGDDAMAEAIDTVRPDIVQFHGSETPEHAAAHSGAA